MVLLITGCRSGIGFATSIEAVRAGHIVYSGFRNIRSIENMKTIPTNSSIIPIQLDITNKEEREAAVERILKEQGRLDVLINNAGIAIGGFLEEVEEDEIRDVFEVNLFSTWAMTKACLPAMRAAHSGTVIIVSSMSGRMALPGLGVYCSSKFALEGLGEAWRHELKPFGINVVIVEPGAYKTDIMGQNRRVCRKENDHKSPYALFVRNRDEWYERKVVKKARDPVEVARYIVSLLEKRKQKFRNPIGPGTGIRSFALKFLPFKFIEHVLRKAITGSK